MLKKFRIPSLQISCWLIVAVALFFWVQAPSEDKMGAALIASAFAICAVLLRGITVYQEAEAYKLADKIEDELKH